MNSITTSYNLGAQNRLDLPFEIYLIILAYLDNDVLMAKMKALDDAIDTMSNKAIRKVMEEVWEQAGTKLISQGAWREYSAKVARSVWARATEKVSGDPLSNAIADILAIKMMNVRLDAIDLKSISYRCQVVSRLRKVSLCTMDGGYIFWFDKIRKLNSNLIWDLGNIKASDLEQICGLEVLNGLTGSMETSLCNQESLHFLEIICRKCHPNFRLKLNMHAISDGTLIWQLGNCTPILARLMTLSLQFGILDLHTTDTNTPDSSAEDGVRALNTICENFKFELKLDIANCRSLRGCTHVLKSLVDVELSSPTGDDIAWLDAVGEQSALQMAFDSVNNVQIARHCAQSRCALRYLGISSPLTGAVDILLFKQICKAHPNLQFQVALWHEGLSSLLRDFPTNITLYLFSSLISCDSHLAEGLEIVCYHGCLQYLQGLDLSLLRCLELILSDDYELNNTLITTIFDRSPNLEELMINTDSRDGTLGEFPGLLQTALDENWKNLKTFTITNIDNVVCDIRLPAFTEHCLGRRRWWSLE